MTLTYVLMQNLKRNPVRTALTAVAFALPMGIFVLSLSFVVGLTETAQSLAKELRLVVRHKIALSVLLPEAIRRKIEELDPNRERLVAVCGIRWFGGRVPETQNRVEALASDHDTLPVVFSEIGLTSEEIAAWERDRRAVIVAGPAALQYGWKVGDRITLESVIPPYLRLEFHVVKVWDAATFPMVVYFRRDYLADSLSAAGLSGATCNTFWVKCRGTQALRALQREIDALFANSPDETQTDDENAFLAGFIQAIGDLPSLARSMALVVVLIIALVAGNTMMMSFRERLRELATFKAIGFQARRVFFIVLSESLSLALVGSLLGVSSVCTTLMLVPKEYLTYGAFAPPRVSWLAVGGSLTIGLAVGLAAGLWPAYRALRLPTAGTLRRVT